MARNIFITGANRGIGFALTKQFLAAGHRVFATYREQKSATELKALANPNLQLLQVDVDSDKSIKELSPTLSEVSHLDILVNNAGVIGETTTELAATSTQKVLETLSINAIGPMRMTQTLMPWLQKSQQPVVAQITSLMGSIADNTSGGYYAYRMSKAALNMFHKSLSIEFPKIACIALHPGWVQTDMGGEAAPLSSTESARGLSKIILECDTKQSGLFLNYKGDRLSW